MKKNLGIRGNEDQGNEIIALLKSLGAVDTGNWEGTDPTKIYFIDQATGLIDAISILVFDDQRAKTLLEYTKMTYDEFRQKYPFMIGDRVLKHNIGIGTIYKMKWDPVAEEVKYYVDFSWCTTQPTEVCTLDDLVLYDRGETETSQKVFDFIESTTTTVNPEHSVVRVIIPESHEVLIRDGEVIFVKKGIIPSPIF
jgi:hypothetical protein